MAALTGNVHLPHKGNPTKMSFLHNGIDEIYAGALVYCDTGGGCQVVPAAGDGFLGIACRRQSAVAGTEVEVYVTGYFLFPVGNLAVTDEGDIAVMDVSDTTTDNPADVEAGLVCTVAANDILIGRILRVTAGEGAWIALHRVSSVWVTDIGF